MNSQATGERRAKVRQKALMTGSIRFRTRTGTLSCVVRNLSETGAKLVVTGSMWLPENFELEIQHQDIRIDARPVWRGATEMGVVFVPRRDGHGHPANYAKRASDEDKVISLEAERDKLKQRVHQLTEEF